jgi:integrase
LIAFFGSANLGEITPRLIEKYKQQRVMRVKPATANRELACLKHLFNMAIRWGQATSNPVREVKFFKEELPPLRILTGEEANRLIAACPAHLKSIVATALNTGMRLREILDLQWQYVDLEAEIITVTNTKTRENRYIPLSPYLGRVFSNLTRVSPFVFVNPDTGKPYTKISQGFQSAVQKAGLNHIRFHDLRHTFASQLVMSGVDIVTVKELLGHRTIKMTMRYSHLNQEHKRSAMHRLMARYGHQMDTNGNSLKLVRS